MCKPKLHIHKCDRCDSEIDKTIDTFEHAYTYKKGIEYRIILCNECLKTLLGKIINPINISTLKFNCK